MTTSRRCRAMDAFGMARRAGALIIGQDDVFNALRKKTKLAVFATEDCSSSVLRKLDSVAERGEAAIYRLSGVDRNGLGGSIGLVQAQIAALPLENGFAKKIITLVEDRSGADE